MSLSIEQTKTVRSMGIYWEEIFAREIPDRDRENIMIHELVVVTDILGHENVLRCILSSARQHEILEKIMSCRAVEDTLIVRAQVGTALKDML